MATELQTHPMHTTAGPNRPAPQTRAQADLLAVYRSKLSREPGEVRFSITEGDRPKGRDLELLRDRAEALSTILEVPTAKREAMVARLFLRWPSGERTDTKAVECYAMDLAEYPAWAITAGIADIIGGLVLKSPEYRPSSLTVRAAVEARYKPVREELGDLVVLLEACERPVPDKPAEIAVDRRKAMADGARARMREIGAEEAETRPRDMRLASAFDAPRMGNFGGGPMQLSDEALALCGRERPMRAEEAI